MGQEESESSMLILFHDRSVLRKWATLVAELAARPIEEEKRRLWLDHNQLRRTRPLVFCSPENSWNEIIPATSLECEGPLARHWEFLLRMQVFSGRRMRDDMVIEPFFTIPHVYTESGWGVQETYINSGVQGGAYTWDSPLKDLGDLSGLRYPTITIDWAESDAQLEEAESIFGDLLTVRRKTFWWWSLGMTWPLVRLRGLERIMWDMVDNPEGLHHLMAFMRDGHLAMVDYLDQQGLLYLNNGGEYVGSGGFGWTDELPQSPNGNGQVHPRDMWGFCESQETGTVSPAMFEEFVFQYQLPLLEKFGLNCYGCCEVLDSRWHVVKKTPRLRRVSVSPWANLERMAENLEAHYIYSMKPNPTALAMPTFDEASIRKDLRKALEITRGCVVEVIMKDNHTICVDPYRVIRWTEIAKEEAERLG